MKNNKLLWAGITLLLLASMFVAVQSVLAGPSPSGTCGASAPVNVNGLVIKKTVDCTRDTQWSWTIDKSADQTNLTLSEGQTFLVNYTVTVNATANSSSYGVSGNIFVVNTTGSPITIESVTDDLAPVSCTLNGGTVSFPFVLGGGILMQCTYGGAIGSQAAANNATVVSSVGQATATAPIDWTKATGTVVDDCALISDTYPGGPNESVCANGQTSWNFQYTREIGPYEACGDFTVENVATFLTDDTGATDSDGWTVNVNVPCAGGCTLTPGYWKTHSTYGPAGYDDTWAQIGENTAFFLSGQSYYQVLWTNPNGNAYYILAHAYIAAKLNQLNGADFSAVSSEFAAATALFNTYTPAQIGALKGNDPVRAQFINLADVLDDYNNGLIGPGHCSE